MSANELEKQSAAPSVSEEVYRAQFRLDQALSELKVAKNEVRHYEDLTERLLSSYAHDLRSPLNNIRSFVELLRTDRRQMSRREIDDILHRMENSALRMSEMVDTLLDNLRAKKEEAKINPQPMLLGYLIKDVLQEMSASFKAKEIKTTFTAIAGELKVKLDPQRGRRIIANLLSNALKFTPRGGQVSVKLWQGEKSRMSFSIKNSGAGIEPEALQSIFERFSQAASKSTEGEKGSGLGLAIVKEFLDLHHGQIEVKSELGQGAEFICHLPVAESSKLLELFSTSPRH